MRTWKQFVAVKGPAIAVALVVLSTGVMQAAAHSLAPTVVEIGPTEDGADLKVRLQLDLERVLAGEGAEHELRHAELRLMAPEALTALAEERKETILRLVAIGDPNAPAQLIWESVRVPPTGDVGYPRISVLQMRAAKLGSAAEVRWRAEPAFGDAVLRDFPGAGGRASVAAYARAGSWSAPLPITSPGAERMLAATWAAFQAAFSRPLGELAPMALAAAALGLWVGGGAVWGPCLAAFGGAWGVAVAFAPATPVTAAWAWAAVLAAAIATGASRPGEATARLAALFLAAALVGGSLGAAGNAFWPLATQAPRAFGNAAAVALLFGAVASAVRAAAARALGRSDLARLGLRAAIGGAAVIQLLMALFQP